MVSSAAVVLDETMLVQNVLRECFNAVTPGFWAISVIRKVTQFFCSNRVGSRGHMTDFQQCPSLTSLKLVQSKTPVAKAWKASRSICEMLFFAVLCTC